MAHEVETMAYAYDEKKATGNVWATDNTYEHPWHINMTKGRSVPVDPSCSPDDMIKAAKLDWTIERTGLYADINGDKIYSGKDALYRSDTGDILTEAGPNWHEVQPEEFSNFFYDFCTEGSMEMNTMGSLFAGKRLFALAKVDAEFSLFRGRDRIESYFLFSNPIEYGQSLDLRFTPTRVVCNNTLTVALKGQNKDMGVRLSHRKKFDAEEVKELLGMAREQLDGYKEAAEFLAGKRWTVDALKEYYMDIWPVRGERKKKDPNELTQTGKMAMAALDTQPGAELGEGSWWQAYNSVTYLIDNVLGKTKESRLNNAQFGHGRKLKVKALNKAIELAEAA